MTRDRRWYAIITVFLMVGLAMLACGPLGGEETPEPTEAVLPAETPAGPGEGRCGDGVCDGPEDAETCPQDCAQATPPPTETPVPAVRTPEPEATTPSGGRCGDGICDEMEQKDSTLCPQDCATPAAATPVSVPPGGAWEAVTLPSGDVAHLGDPATVSQEGGAPGVTRQVNISFILDASGSMNAELPGTGKTRLAVAKEVMAKLIPQIPAEANGALWIYGHRYPQEPKENSCQDIERVFALGPVDATACIQRINAITAIGYTPIADSIEQAAQDLPAGDFNSIILVSDGEETCGGDPCALAEALKASDAAVTIHVVGYAVEEVAREQLQCTAQVSGGTYHDAEDAEGLLQALEEAMAATVAETILRVEVAGSEGQEVHANVYLYEAGTDRRVSVYFSWQDNSAPPGSYDLQIDTLPWTLYRDLTLPEGSTTIVRVILGAISVVTPEDQPMAADFYDAASDTHLGYWGHEGPVMLVPGTYYVQVHNSTSAPIAVHAGETANLILGAISVLTPEGKLTAADFYDAASGTRLGYWGHEGPVMLVPGSYYVQVNQSTSVSIAVKAGKTEELLLGAIHVDGQFNVWDAGGTRLGYYGDTLLLVPGIYKVELSDGSTVENVMVEAGQVTEVE